ncbi:hypothetical protein RDWZM_001631 [Blomia tropicalis]|uniref:PABP n=1 Tax=Blomia tropicalis TaxID=40697 RepID=A0A9Q0RQT8_BLOTA|nr:hypothetical protein RDWZM_001631 [Blomia tropicalis]
MNSTSNSSNHYPIASLYVGDLAPDVTEAILFEKFSTAGPVLSIRVCRDIITRRSLGYAYVNYQNAADADRAIDTLNFEKLASKPIRIMWSQRDPSLRRSGLGNIFIKNLDKTVDNKVMFDTFSVFGNILSCKVSYDDKGQSKGYGFVHFDSEEAATSAITNLNGKIVIGKKIYVGKFVSRKERDTKMGGHRRFTNVYVKNLPVEEFNTDEKLNDLFSPYGSITSAIVVKDDNNKSKGFGFVCFASAEGAEAAVSALNGKDMGIPNKPLYVGRAQKKAEREAELKRRQEAIKAERINRSQAQRKEDREAQKLNLRYTQSGVRPMPQGMAQQAGLGPHAQPGIHQQFQQPGMPMAGPLQGHVMPGMHPQQQPYLMPVAPQTGLNRNFYTNAGPGAPQVAGGQNPQGIRVNPRWGNQMTGPMGRQGGAGNYNSNYRNMNPRVPGGAAGQVRQNVPGAGSVPGGAGAAGPRGPFVQQNMTVVPNAGGAVVQSGRVQRGGPAGQAPIRGQKSMLMGAGPGGMGQPIIVNQMMHNTQMPNESNISDDHPYQALGEQLYPKVAQLEKNLAGKITGMFLEMESAEVIHMLESPEFLKSKVEEAMAVLAAANRDKEGMAQE